jgi:hypothetical protein
MTDFSSSKTQLDKVRELTAMISDPRQWVQNESTERIAAELRCILAASSETTPASNPKSFACQHDPLVFGTITAGFHRLTLGGDPVLTITDQEAPGEPEVCLDWLEARALRDWLSGVLSAHETADDDISEDTKIALAVEIGRCEVRHVITDVEAIAADRTDAYWAGYSLACEEILHRVSTAWGRTCAHCAPEKAPRPIQTEECPACHTVHDKPLCPAPKASTPLCDCPPDCQGPDTTDKQCRAENGEASHLQQENDNG